jgi:hypothetical protein
MLTSIARKFPFFLALPALVACNGTVVFGGGAGGEPATTGGDTTTGGQWTGAVSSSSGWWMTTSATTSTGSGPPPVYECSGPNSGSSSTPCAIQDAGCNPGLSACGATEVYDGAPRFALRMAHVDFQKPYALSTGVAKSLLQNWLAAPPPVCHLPDHLLTWILELDLNEHTLTTGGAVVNAGAAPGALFINQSIESSGYGTAMIPATGPLMLGNGCDLDVTVGDVNMPVQYDAAGPGNIYLPFRHLRFSGGKVTPDHNCIGRYADEELSPASGCAAPAGASPYQDGAELHGIFTLEDADKVVIGPLQESLCVFLSGDANTYGMQVDQFKRCKRDASNHIVFPGDYCSVTNQPAQGGCADALEVSATFTAVGVKAAY